MPVDVTTNDRLPIGPHLQAAPVTSAAAGKPGRIEALDLAKGMLVVFMVVYHSLNYSTDYRLPFRYLSFLPPSFILVSGFLLSHVYLARRGVVDAALSRRLLARGAKLLLLFTLLNVAGQFARSQSYHGPARVGAFTDEWREIFFFGGSRAATFDILLPIAYLLLLAPALLWLGARHRFVLPALTVALLAACAGLERYGGCPPNLAFLAAGIVGIVAGSMPRATLARAARLLPWSIPAYGALAYLGFRFGQSVLHQLLAAAVALAILIGLGLLLPSHRWIGRRLGTLGRLSLAGYIVQIAILQVYSHVLGRPDPSSPALLVMLGTTLIATAAAVELLAWTLPRSRPLRAAYQAVVP